MPDETTSENVSNKVAIETPVAEGVILTPLPVVKKARAPRRSKAAMEAARAETSEALAEKPAKKTRAKRGSKLVVAKAEKSVSEPKKGVTRGPRARAVPSPPASSIDDIADLIKLEEENKQLRKELSDKLRAENADLRRRLGRG